MEKGQVTSMRLSCVTLYNLFAEIGQIYVIIKFVNAGQRLAHMAPRDESAQKAIIKRLLCV